MSIEFNHTIVWCSDQKRSAAFFSELLGLPSPRQLSHLMLSIWRTASRSISRTVRGRAPQHYAFLMSETEFDAIMQRIDARKLTYWADPARRREGEVNRRDGGRGVYFEAPDGQLLEALTRPYGSGNGEWQTK